MVLLAACLFALALVTALGIVGLAAAELFVGTAEGTREKAFTEAASPVIGVAVLVATLDVVGFFLPLRIAAWSFVPLIACAVIVLRRARKPLFSRSMVLSVLGVALGAVPVFVVGRVTVAALTNDDATYYISAADQLLRYPWMQPPAKPRGLVCLSVVLVHSWLWRTGVPNLLGTVSTLAHIEPTAGIAIVTMLLTGLVAHAGHAIAVSVGVRRAKLAGALTVVSAAPVFLAWQHLLGQLFAFSLFPLGVVALAHAARDGGFRRIALAALLLGAGMNGFADAAVPLVLCALSVVAFGGLAGMPRVVASGLLAAVFFPFTAWRAAWALYGTMVVRTKTERAGLFPQRGWLPRNPLDDLATLSGVDPWPPWPASSGPFVLALIERLATLAVIGLLVWWVVRERKRRGVVVCAVVSVLVVAFVMVGIDNRYLRAKWLLLEAAFVVPLAIAAGMSRLRYALIPVVVANVVAIAQLARPSGFHVVDMPDHDRLATELSAVPPGSPFVLDGFGAPADVVHDEHRAYRAAQIAGLMPIQPGLDGGFYKPTCAEPSLETVAAAAADGWALQRDGVEHLSRGKTVARFGRFSLVRADLGTDFVASWAPTHGWLRAETEPDGTVFRWGEAVAAGTLTVVSRYPCGRLVGEVRSVDAVGNYTVLTGEHVLASAALEPTWSQLRTPVVWAHELPIEFRTEGARPDDAHAIAVRKLAFEPVRSCTNVIVKNGAPAEFPDPLVHDNTYGFTVPAGVSCGRVIATLEASAASSVVVISGTNRVATAFPPGRSELKSWPIDFRNTSTITLQRADEEGDTAAPRVVEVRVEPLACDRTDRVLRVLPSKP